MEAVPASLAPPERLLLGPGPSPVPASILAAMGKPTLGHLDPAFLALMDEVRAMLRAVFRTENELTLPMSGTGSAGMETCLVNMIEPEDRVLVAKNGVFGTRMAEVARRAGAHVHEIELPWGEPVTPDDLRGARDKGPFRLVCCVHAETSTGARSDVAACAEVARELDALFVVDAVTSLGGLPVELDAWGIDAVYSGTQKCLACPPGLSPVSFSTRARERMAARRTPVQSWYLDLSLIAGYWGAERAYHHTAPIQAIYGLHEALRLVLEEGLEARWKRHEDNARLLWSGLAELGLELLVPEAHRLTPLTAVEVPDGVDETDVRARMLREDGIEIGGGLGPLKGKVWRIGLMGAGSTAENVERVLDSLGRALGRSRG